MIIKMWKNCKDL